MSSCISGRVEKSKTSVSTSDKRKEQVRRAQQAYRQRTKQRAEELEQQNRVLEAKLREKVSEASHWKQQYEELLMTLGEGPDLKVEAAKLISDVEFDGWLDCVADNNASESKPSAKVENKFIPYNVSDEQKNSIDESFARVENNQFEFGANCCPLVLNDSSALITDFDPVILSEESSNILGYSQIFSSSEEEQYDEQFIKQEKEHYFSNSKVNPHKIFDDNYNENRYDNNNENNDNGNNEGFDFGMDMEVNFSSVDCESGNACDGLDALGTTWCKLKQSKNMRKTVVKSLFRSSRRTVKTVN